MAHDDAQRERARGIVAQRLTVRVPLDGRAALQHEPQCGGDRRRRRERAHARGPRGRPRLRVAGRYRWTLVVSEPDGAGGATEVATPGRALVCKYVRREIRSLSAADRDAYLDAFEVMMRINASEGVARYGRQFRTIDEFAKMHLNLAADRECDRMHDGMGFLTNHAALTSAFEHGLQLVDPKLSVPYWDYTWDEREFRKRHGAFGEGRDAEFWRMDDMWSDEWFGSAENEHRTVVSGRFAWQTVTTGAGGGWANSVHNSYGYLRAPWNVNKYPYVTRGHELCGTSAFNFAGAILLSRAPRRAVGARGLTLTCPSPRPRSLPPLRSSLQGFRRARFTTT